MIDGYIPQNQRKKILLLSDDLRWPSGVGNQSREIVVSTAHRYNWVQLAAGVNHPEVGKVFDASADINTHCGISDGYLRIYPSNGYGDPNAIRQLIHLEKPDAILHFTDPRYWIWLYEMEHEIRQQMPLMFYHVWDDLPFPKYNESYYRSCDYIACISKQTYNIVKNVRRVEPNNPYLLQYIPHGVNPSFFFKITEDNTDEWSKLQEVRKALFQDKQTDFVVFYNSRNLGRKATGNIILAFNKFVQGLPEEQRDKVCMVMHTAPVDDHGTDLPAIIRDLTQNCRIIIDPGHVDLPGMNRLYNIADVTINLSSAEGFGLGTLESLMAETMIIANVTGGLQDQMGFEDENGDYLDPDKHFTADWGSNADGRYKKCGEWAIPLFPTNRSLVGSPPTPYIFDDRCSWEEAADAIRKVYDMSEEERANRGKYGRAYVQGIGMTSTAMGQRFIEGIDKTFETWKPRRRFDVVKA